jgi:hypothetical protein
VRTNKVSVVFRFATLCSKASSAVIQHIYCGRIFGLETHIDLVKWPQPIKFVRRLQKISRWWSEVCRFWITKLSFTRAHELHVSPLQLRVNENWGARSVLCTQCDYLAQNELIDLNHGPDATKTWSSTTCEGGKRRRPYFSAGPPFCGKDNLEVFNYAAWGKLFCLNFSHSSGRFSFSSIWNASSRKSTESKFICISIHSSSFDTVLLLLRSRIRCETSWYRRMACGEHCVTLRDRLPSLFVTLATPLRSRQLIIGCEVSFSFYSGLGALFPNF